MKKFVVWTFYLLLKGMCSMIIHVDNLDCTEMAVMSCWKKCFLMLIRLSVWTK